MIDPSKTLFDIPKGLRDPLLSEYRTIVQNFLEHRWLPSELSGGRFAEIVYTILEGYANGKTYAPVPYKPANFVNACQKLENQAHLGRSFQILIPRILPALYEIRNNRSVGHVGGDVDPNHMDAVAVLTMSSWVMAELIRVFHKTSTIEAQKVVDSLVEIRLPTVWTDGSVKRVLIPSLRLSEQLLILIATSIPDVTDSELIAWTEHGNDKYFFRTLRGMHSKRLIEYNESTHKVQLLPPGTAALEALLKKRKLSPV
jgi:hypothetical protein